MKNPQRVLVFFKPQMSNIYLILLVKSKIFRSEYVKKVDATQRLNDIRVMALSVQ